jgi:putative heme-binding domain-containing protein
MHCFAHHRSTAFLLVSLSPCLLVFATFSRAATRADEAFDPEPVVALFELVAENTDDPQAARECLGVLAEKVQTRELSGQPLDAIRKRLQPPLAKILGEKKHPLFLEAALLSAAWKDEKAIAAVRNVLSTSEHKDAQRLKALAALIAAGDKSLHKIVAEALTGARHNSAEFRAGALSALGRSDSPHVAEIVLAAYPQLEPDLQPKAIELLTQRPVWAKALLAAIGAGKLPSTVLNTNQVARLLRSRDEELVKLVKDKWGTVRTERNPDRERVIAGIREQIRRTPGDPFRGEVVFKALCAQCHKIYGEGHEVGPDLTSNGRSSFDQILSNVFDPNLVIGSAYQLYTVIDGDGRSISGLLVEDNDQRITLKLQGGKTESVARGNIEEVIVSQLSMMPEDVEKQFSGQQIADLFAFLTLDKHPKDPTAKQLPGVREGQP